MYVTYWFHPVQEASKKQHTQFQAHSSSYTIGGDQKIVTATDKTSLRKQKKLKRISHNWQALREDNELTAKVNGTIMKKLNSLPAAERPYSNFVAVCNAIR